MAKNDHLPMADRLEEKIERVTESGCWIWIGSMFSKGYGQIWREGKLKYAHRVSYEIHVGQIPEGLELDHLCRNRCCVNPSHLEPVTHKENLRRGFGLMARQSRQTHCLRGHEFSEENTHRYKTRRVCKKCSKDRNKYAA